MGDPFPPQPPAKGFSTAPSALLLPSFVVPRSRTTLHAGDPAPEFALPDVSGHVESLSGLLAVAPLLLFFFRGTWCPNCRKQWTELQPHMTRLLIAGVQCRGVIAQSPVSVAAYAKSPGLPFPMLIDESRAVIRAYGVWHLLGLDAINIARPSTFLIDQNGIVKWLFVSNNQFDRPTPQMLLEAVRDHR